MDEILKRYGSRKKSTNSSINLNMNKGYYSDENLKAKSLRLFSGKYNPKYAVRTSMSNYRKEEWLVNIPLWAVWTV